MELQTAIEILEDFQAWRIGNTDDFMTLHKTLTGALDVVLREVKGLPAKINYDNMLGLGYSNEQREKM